jgi:uncharacterized membrane protein
MSEQILEDTKQLEVLVNQVEPGLLKQLEPQKQKQVLHLMAVASQKSYSGPVPPAEMIAAYGQAIPNGGDRLFSMVEAQSAHRQKMEAAVIESQVKQSATGQWMAFWLALTLIAVGTCAFLTGHDAVANVIFGGTIVGLATTFIVGKHYQKQDLKEKKPTDIPVPKVTSLPSKSKSRNH